MSAISEWIELLCVTVEAFGVDRPSVEVGRARFPLRGCTASIYRSGRVEDCWQVELLDMSSSGTGFASPIGLESGERFTMRFDSESLGGREWEMAAVWACRRPDDSYLIGARRLDSVPSPLAADPITL